MATVVLFSGGMDSLIGWQYVNQPDAVYVTMGHRYQAAELQAVKRLRATGIPIRVVEGMHLGTFEHPDANIPARNLHLAMVAAWLGYDRICLISQSGEQMLPDRSYSFFVDASRLLSRLYDKDIVLDPVFGGELQLTKSEMLRWYLSSSANLTRERLAATVACYAGTACGNCPACFRRAVAMTLNGIDEKHAVDVWRSPTAKAYFDNVDRYDIPRVNEIRRALSKHGSIRLAQGWEWVG